MSEKIILDDIANGQENVRIPVVNDIDDEEAPKVGIYQLFITFSLDRVSTKAKSVTHSR